MKKDLVHDMVKEVTTRRHKIQKDYVKFYLSHFTDKQLKSKNFFKKIEICETIDGLTFTWSLREKAKKK